MLNHLLQDFRYGVRTLLSRPGFTLAAVLTLALGIGANTAVFSVVDALLLKSLPYPDSEQLVDINNTYPRNDLLIAGDSIPDYLDRREQAAALSDVALYTQHSYNLSADGAPQRLNGILTTPSLFSTLAVGAGLGRTLAEGDARPGNDHVAVLSFALWKNQFAGDTQMIGRDVRLNGDNYRVVGVMPEGFFFPNRETQLWTPFVFSDKQRSDDERGNEFSGMVGRLKPGATIAQLDAQMDAIVQHNLERVASTPRGSDWKQFVDSSGFTGRARTLRDAWIGNLGATLLLLQALVGCVLLIACANVANLMLTRVSARQVELSVRSALGAGRGRIARQLLVESLLLALAGGVAGIAFAGLGVRLIRTLGLGTPGNMFSISIDLRVLAFALVAAVATGLLFGLFPVISLARGRPVEALKEGGRGSGGSRSARATRRVLAVVQMAMAVALLAGAGLLIRSFIAVQRQDPGFSTDNVLSATIDLPDNRYKDDASQAHFYDRVLDEVRALPGVKSAGLVSSVPFSGNDGSASYIIDGVQAQGGITPHGFVQMVDEDFFRSLQIPVLQGRTFARSDAQDAPRVAVIDELLAKKYFRGESPIGKRIAFEFDNTDAAKTKWMTIVGVVPTIKHDKLSEQTIKETIYFYYRQQPFRQATLALRTEQAAQSLTAPLRAALQRVDPDQPAFDIRTMSERVALSLDDRRTPMLLLMLFAAVALALSAIGIYGVLAFSVSSRTGELGVRMSIGASSKDILKLVLADGARLAAIGLVLGLAASLALSQLIKAQLFGVAVVDPLTLSGVTAVLGLTALIACWLPARRAARVDPIAALRKE